MEKLTTHALDTAAGRPAAGLRVRLLRGDDDGHSAGASSFGEPLVEATTNADGRCDQPLLSNPEPGRYRLLFAVGDYFRARGVDSPFLDEVPVDFVIRAGESYHVPLVFTPWSYSTYRGS